MWICFTVWYKFVYRFLYNSSPHINGCVDVRDAEEIRPVMALQKTV